jgi:hypothetical protein
MSSEFYEENGGVHLVVERSQIKPAISGLLKFRGFKNNLDTGDFHNRPAGMSEDDWL